MTDHQPLKWLMSIKNPASRLARWIIRLEEYTFKIQYKTGKTNGAADGLSRMVSEDDLIQQDEYEDIIINIIILRPIALHDRMIQFPIQSVSLEYPMNIRQNVTTEHTRLVRHQLINNLLDQGQAY